MIRKIIFKALRFISEFKSRDGFYVFSATILTKIIGFILSIFVVRFLTKEAFGNISYARSILQIIIPFIGFGANNALLRYGSVANNERDKISIFKYAQRKGFVFSLFLIGAILLLTPTLTHNIPGARIFLYLLSFGIVGSHLFNTLLSLFRVLKKNKLYALSSAGLSICLFAFGIILTYFFKGIGYSISIIMSPLFVFFILYYQINKRFEFSVNDKNIRNIIIPQKFWLYGLNIGFGAIASQLLFQVDVLMLGNMKVVAGNLAIYKVATLLPYNLFFIPNSILRTDFVVIAENSKNKFFLTQYYKKYLSLFTIITIPIVIIMFFYAKYIILFVFGENYIEAAPLLKIFSISVFVTFMIRSPLGNILNAIGKASWNVINAYITVVTNIILNYYFIKEYGILGAAFATTFSLSLGAIVSIILFYLYVKKLN